MFRKGDYCDKTKKCLFNCLINCVIVSSPPIWPGTVQFFLSLFRFIFISFEVRARRQTCQSLIFMSQKTGAELMNSQKTREFQTQLLHYFSKSDNKSNHHHTRRWLWTCPSTCQVCVFSVPRALALCPHIILLCLRCRSEAHWCTW